MPSPHFNTIPAPPGIGPDDDIYRSLSRWLDGPTLKLYYDMAVQMRDDPSKKDKYKKGDGLSYQDWRESARKAIMHNILQQKYGDKAYDMVYGDN